VPAEVWAPPKYENPSDDPTIKNVMSFSILQEMRAIESVQDKRTTPKEDVDLATKKLITTYHDVKIEIPRHW